MPRYRALFHLDKAPGCSLSIILEDLFDLAHPRHIQALCQVRPRGRLAIRRWLLDEGPVLSREAYLCEVSKMLVEESAVAPGDDVDDILRVIREFLQSLQSVG